MGGNIARVKEGTKCEERKWCKASKLPSDGQMGHGPEIWVTSQNQVRVRGPKVRVGHRGRSNGTVGLGQGNQLIVEAVTVSYTHLSQYSAVPGGTIWYHIG